MGDTLDTVTVSIDAAAEVLYRTVADIDDSVERARAGLEVVQQIQDRILPDMVNIRRVAIKDARNRMSAQDLAERLGISRARIYALLNSAEGGGIAGPVTIAYRTSQDKIAEARVSWDVEVLRGDQLIRVTRQEIRRRWDRPAVTVVVPSATIDLPTNDAEEMLAGAFRGLESEAAYALSEADRAAQSILDGIGHADRGTSWYFADSQDPEPFYPRWPRTRYVRRQ